MNTRDRNPNHGKFVKPDGYTDVGYNFGVTAEIKSCYAMKHKCEQFDNSLYKWRNSDLITICHECKIIWHTDMTD